MTFSFAVALPIIIDIKVKTFRLESYTSKGAPNKIMKTSCALFGTINNIFEGCVSVGFEEGIYLIY